MTDRPVFVVSDDTIAAFVAAKRAEDAGDAPGLRVLAKEALDLLAGDCCRHMIGMVIGPLLAIAGEKPPQ